MFKNVKVYIAGVINGSQNENVIYNQDYRQQITDKLTQKYPGINVYDPFKDQKAVLSKSEEDKKAFFLDGINRCLNSTDLIISYLPTASMGTAIEMYEAWVGRAVVVTVSPMESNWTVKYLSDKVYECLGEFLKGINNGDLDEHINKISQKK